MATFDPRYASVPKAQMPQIGFGGMTTFQQYSPQTMSMTSQKVIESAAKLKQAKFPTQQPLQSAQNQQYVPSADEIAKTKQTKYMSRDYAKYVISQNPGKKPSDVINDMISKGYSIEGLNAPASEAQTPSAPVQQAQSQPSEAGRSPTFMESMGKSAKSIIGGAGVVAGSIPKLVGGVVDIGEELLGGGDGIGEKIKGAGEALQEKSLDLAGIKGGFTRGAAKFVSDVALPVGGLAAAGSKAIQGTAGAQKVSGIIGKIPGAEKVAKAATSTIGKSAGAGALYTSMTPDADLGDIATGAAISGAVPIVGKALKPAKEVVAGIIGKASGQGAEAIKTAYASGHKKAFQEPQNFEKIVDTMKGGIRNVKSIRKAMYGTAYDVFEEQSKKLGKIATDDVVKIADDSIDEFGKIKVVINPKTKKASITKSRDLSIQITSESDKKLLSDVYKEVDGYKKGATLEQLESLKGNIVSAMKDAKEGSKTYGALERIRDGITTKLEHLSPVYKKMNEHYSKISGEIKDIEKTLSLGGKSNAQTAITKLAQVLKDKQNDEFKRQMVRQLESLSGDRDIMTRIASASMDNWVPTGLIGVATGGVAGAASVGGLASLKTLFGMLTIGSPKLHKELAIALGKSRSFVTNLANKYKEAAELAKKGYGAIPSASKMSTAIPRSMVAPENEEGSYQEIINRR